MSGPLVPILMYHQVSPRPLPAFRQYCVTPRAFASQMSWLARAGYVPVDIAALLEHRAGRASLPPKPVVITFDDGFRDCMEHAVPVLEEHGFPAMFYLVAGLMGRTSRWLAKERGVELPLMDWASARRLATAGFRCGAHSLTHPRLAEVSPAECRGQLEGSRRLLEEKLGLEVRDLSYPFGSYNDDVREMALQAGYRSACSVRTGLSGPDDDPLALHRVRVDGRDFLLDFACRLRTARSPRELLRAKTRGVWRRAQP